MNETPACNTALIDDRYAPEGVDYFVIDDQGEALASFDLTKEAKYSLERMTEKQPGNYRFSKMDAPRSLIDHAEIYRLRGKPQPAQGIDHAAIYASRRYQ